MSEAVKSIPSPEFPTPAIAQKAEAALAVYKEIRDRLNSPKPQQEEHDPVLEACRSGDLGAATAWIGRGIDVDAYKNAVFMWAIEHGETETVGFLMQQGVELDFLHNAPIREAAVRGYAKIVALLIEGGVDIQAGNNEAIRMAAHNGHLEVVCLLIKNGVSIRSLDAGAMRGAVTNGHTEVVRLLIENGAMVVPNDYMVVAAQKGHTDIVRLLIENGADISVLHNQALIIAARYHHTETVRVLLEHGADATAQDHEAVWIAAQQGDIEIVRLLIKNGADVTANDNYAIRAAAMNGHTAVIALLIENGADVTVLDHSSVRSAARGNHVGTLRLLVEHGADITARDNDAVIEAATHGNIDTVRLLIELGADIHARQEAALRFSENVAMKALLVQHGASAVLHHQTQKTLEHYQLQARRWHQVLRREPLLEIWREDPALFNGTCYESVRRILEAEGYAEPTVSTMAFHTAALFQSTECVLQYLKQWSEPGRQQRLHDLVKMIHVPSALPGEVKPNLKDWADGVLKCGPSMARLVKFADKVPSPMKTDDGRTWSMLKTWEECARFRFRRAGENIALAALCFERGVDERVFEEALEHYQLQVPRWHQVLRREPLLEIWREDPALFKGTCYESVRRMLAVEGYGEPTVSTMAFHTAALFQSPERVLQYLKQWGEPGRQQPLHNLVQMIHVPSALPGGVKPNLKDWADGVLKCGPSMARLVKFADKVSSPMKTEDGRTWSMLRTREECARFGFRRAGENFALAALCFEHDLNERVFDKALAIIQEKQPANKNIPGIDLKGDEFGMPGGRFRRLADGDIKGLFLGEMTDCCQSVGGQGAACAEHGFTSADGGFYVVENAKGKVVGQSWAWRGAGGELCLDSLETLGQNVTGAQWFDIIGAFRAALSARNNHNITALTVGTGGATNDSCPGLKKIFTQAADAKPRDYDGYRDSHKQVAVWEAPHV